jgi:hypothetical protein
LRGDFAPTGRRWSSSPVPRLRERICDLETSSRELIPFEAYK